MALYHCRILAERQPTGTNWNNLGVALDRLGLNSLAITAFRNSERLRETLAMSNLAHKLIYAGFLKEANELANTAMLIENYHPNIGSVITSINDKSQREDKEEEKIINGLRMVRQFYTDYANAYLKEDITTIQESWQGPRCPLKITIDGEFIEIVGSYDKPTGKYGLTPFTLQDKKPPTENVKYKGKILGHSVLFQSWVWEGEVPLKADAAPKTKGVLIVDDNKRRIRILEHESRKDGNIIEIIPIE